MFSLGQYTLPYLISLPPLWSRCLLLLTVLRSTDSPPTAVLFCKLAEMRVSAYSARNITSNLDDRHKHTCGIERKRYHMPRDNPVLPYILWDVKFLRLGCRCSACGSRRVPALLVFYSYFGSQNTVHFKSQCMKMPPIMSKLKGFFFSYTVYAQTDSAVSLPPCLFHLPFPSFSDVAEARSYFASTVLPVACRHTHKLTKLSKGALSPTISTHNC
jgi:hypothetical protein